MIFHILNIRAAFLLAEEGHNLGYGKGSDGVLGVAFDGKPNTNYLD